jgi:hypothetical protein
MGIQADGMPRGQTPAAVKVLKGAQGVHVPTTPVPGLKDNTTFDEDFTHIESGNL